MDFERFYDNYWQEKGDEVDYNRLNPIIEKVNPEEAVLEVGGHIGLLAEKIQEKGAEVTVTDISKVALKRAEKRGIKKTVHVDLDEEPLPFEDGIFDVVISNSSIEHIFYPLKMIKECTRVLKTGGRFILSVPNIGHWRFRLWLLFGRFPYLPNTPTDELHIRFMTAYEAKKMCRGEGMIPEALEGDPGLWVKELYPFFLRIKYIRFIYKHLARHYPSLLSRYFILTCRKQK